MLKEKFLHRHGRSYNNGYYDGKRKTKHRKNFNNIDLSETDFDDFNDIYIPKKMKYYWCKFNYLDTTPLIKFLESKIGCDWNDIYSEVLAKTKKKYRVEVENTLKWAVCRPVYDEDYMPHHVRGYRSLDDRLFINLENKLVKMSNEDILKEANKHLRREKIRKLMEAIKNEEESSCPPDL